jgi:hypothetical protein
MSRTFTYPILSIYFSGTNRNCTRLFISEDPYHHNFYDVAELFIELYLFTFIEAKDSTSKIKRNIFNQWSRYINNPNPKKYDF